MDGRFEPERRVLSRIEIIPPPASAILSVGARGNTLQLTVLAYDQATNLLSGTNAATLPLSRAKAKYIEPL